MPTQNMTVWPLTKDRVIIACRGLLPRRKAADDVKFQEEAAVIAPEWPFPSMRMAGRGKSARAKEIREMALSRSRTSKDSEWIRRAIAGEDLSKLGQELRRDSKVLNEYRERLATDYKRVAMSPSGEE